MDEYIYEGEITDEVIRKWAYDEDIWLSEQDEDLLLGDMDYFPVLLEVAEDKNCPKGGYALSIIDFYLMFRVLTGDKSAIDLINQTVDLCESMSNPDIASLKTILLKRAKYVAGLPCSTIEEALAMGHILLNGISRNTELSIVDESTDKYTVELSVPPFHTHKERLFICKDTGSFKFKRKYGDRWL